MIGRVINNDTTNNNFNNPSSNTQISTNIQLNDNFRHKSENENIETKRALVLCDTDNNVILLDSTTSTSITRIAGIAEVEKSEKQKSRKKKQSSSTTDKTTTSITTTRKKSGKIKFQSYDPTKQERPAVEGSEHQIDVNDENDPEQAEWSKLRCTSERTEVVAEREHRRQNRRCADYPGLAFGRSIFSSDTMMKFNIIRNELHNIMNTQLKRVGHRTQRNNDALVVIC